MMATPSADKLPTALAELATHRTLAKGDIVFRMNSAARHVYFLQTGRVVLHRFGPSGEEVVIHVAHAGEFFAEASLHSERYHCTAVATADSAVAAIAAADLRHRLTADADFAMHWLAIVARQLRRSRARVERLSLKLASERVRHLLVTEGRGTIPTFETRGTLRELASELGLTHETLYRTLASMVHDGSIERQGEKIVLLR